MGKMAASPLASARGRRLAERSPMPPASVASRAQNLPSTPPTIGNYLINLSLTNSDKSTGSAVTVLHVSNTAPAVTALGIAAAEVAPLTTVQVATFTDPDVGQTHTATINW